MKPHLLIIPIAMVAGWTFSSIFITHGSTEAHIIELFVLFLLLFVKSIIRDITS